MLRRLRAAGLKTAILSNGTPRMIEALVAGAGLEFDALLSVEQAGVYKPHAERLPAGARRLRPAGAGDRLPVVERLGRLWRLGLRPAGGVVQPQPASRASACPARPDREVESLAALPGLVGA